MKLKVDYIPIEQLKPYEKNAKIHTPEQIEQIKNSIQEFGMNDPIGIWGEENLIVEGHGRLIACKELGFDEVPVIRLDSLTDEQRRAYTLVHNQTTMKPVGLFDYQIKNSTKKCDNVLDLFGGSGTTIMACEQNGRNAYVMEYDPHYIDVIIERWENFTGQKAKLLNKV